MRVEVFYYEPFHTLLETVNVSGTDRLTGNSQQLRKAFDRDLPLNEGAMLERCEQVWQLLGNNANSSKPPAFQDRTMCTGDLVRWGGDDGRVFQALDIGFAQVPQAMLREHELVLDDVALIDFPTFHGV